MHQSPVERVRAFMQAQGITPELVRFDQPLPTCAAAAAAVGVAEGQIAKSVVFICDGAPALVIASGDRRVDRTRLREALAVRKVQVASPEQVLTATGFVAGGVAPVGLAATMPVLLDQDLQRFDKVWAGGGEAEWLMRLSVADLPRLTGGRFAAVCQPV